MENEITVNNVVYVKKVRTLDNYCIVRTVNAGVFAGYIASRDGDECVMTNARRLWYWEGAASLSQLAMEGTSNPKACKFPVPVHEVTLLGVCEIIPCTQQAKDSIEGVPVWKA